jgi:hypothetical protein
MSIVLGTGILNPAFRIAGVTQRPMRTPSPDQYAEGITILNRMLGSWDIDPLDIFTYKITLYALTANQISYQFGVGAADFPAAAAPIAITQANVILPGTPLLRYPLTITDKAGWAQIVLQAIPGGIPNLIYPDFGYPICTLYIYPQAEAGYQLELYTPQTLPVFSLVTDTVVLPMGYEEAIVTNLALKIAKSFRTQTTITPAMVTDAARSLAYIQSRNAPVPKLRNDAANLTPPRGAGDWNWWRTGGYGS